MPTAPRSMRTVVSKDNDASHIGSFVRFNTSENEKVLLKLAVSFTSFEKAEEFLSAEMSGYPGNEDTGAMASWYVFSAIGLFPNAGQDYYYLNAPKYTESVLDLGNGKTLTIRSDAAPGKVYIKACKVGGKQWDKATITHDELVNAGIIEMELSDSPTEWATNK